MTEHVMAAMKAVQRAALMVCLSVDYSDVLKVARWVDLTVAWTVAHLVVPTVEMLGVCLVDWRASLKAAHWAAAKAVWKGSCLVESMVVQMAFVMAARMVEHSVAYLVHLKVVH